MKKLFRYLYFAAVLFSSCLITESSIAQTKPDDRVIIPDYDRKSDVIFFTERKITPDQIINNFDKTRFKNLVKRSTIYYCQSCDSTIFRISGLDGNEIARSFGESQASQKPDEGSGKNEPKATQDSTIKTVTGRIGRVSYIVNYRLQTPDENEGNSPDLAALTPQLSRDIPLKRTSRTRVAILDSGLDSALAKYYRIDNIRSCINKGEIGWSFTDNSSNYTDDYKPSGKKQYHGWPVASLVIQEANRSRDLAVLPVKVLDKNGVADLYSVMCGLAYAKSAGAKIINMSLGMYASPRSAVKAFEDYLRTITDAGIFIVAAAGNATEEDKLLKGRAAANPRNLDYHPFYPAAFSDSNQNIISVTTAIVNPLHPQTLSLLNIVDRQNYSNKRVQIAVMADSINNSFFLPGHKGFRIGSSFAAPIVTGKIAALYDEFITKYPAAERNRENLLNLLVAEGLIKKMQPLQSKIYNGYLMVSKNKGTLTLRKQ